MKHKIFISYSDLDRQKVDIIVEELKSNIKFEPLVIAFNREALKPLADKVSTGIIQSEVIIPILTKSSIATQWINQEIGFATALNKKIMPIVELDLISELKGFIHKQIDLPYSYLINSDLAIEEENFLVQLKHLLNDLDKEYDFKKTDEIIVLPEKSAFEKNLEKLDEMNSKLEIERGKKNFLNSGEGYKAAMNELTKMFEEVENRAAVLRSKKIICNTEKDPSDPYILIKSNDFCFSLEWSKKYYESLEEAILFVKFWKGYVTFDNNSTVFPREKPKLFLESKYSFDQNINGENCWLSKSDLKNYFSTQIVDSCIDWLINEITIKQLGNK